jgi:hypothetical protein
VELVEEFVDLAQRRADFHGMTNVSFHNSPDGQSLPEGLGDFDFVMLSAVYEHLLPAERTALLPVAWGRVKPGGVLFINQLPHRYSPVEEHSTGLPLINYLPDRLAHRFAVRFARGVDRHTTWEQLLRGGIRGATANELLGILASTNSGKPVLLEPRQFGMRDRVDLWYELSSGHRLPAVKRAMMRSFKALQATTGITFVPELSLAIQKPEAEPA